VDSVRGKEGKMRHSGHGRFGEWKVTGQGQTGKFGPAVGPGVGSVGDEVAHVRARFAVDPATPARLSDAWSAPTGATEEDESELIDAVADCLSVGLPLDAAVASWRSGSLQVSDRDDDDEDDTDVFGDEEKTDVYERHSTARRRIVES
jgi:hypothetical protein